MSDNFSKVKKFENQFIDENGCSDFIHRFDDLPDYARYTSGDSIFRNDADLGCKYKICRFAKKFTLYGKTSRSWDLTEEDKVMLAAEHVKLSFPEKSGNSVYYIKFYGKGTCRIKPKIRNDIKKAICKLPCCHCGTTTGIECDHKNDLALEQNDERVLNIMTQTIDDFQPLCKHCNDVKRAVKARMKKEKKRQGAPGYPPHLSFWMGDETLDMNDFYWYKGTYWGDVKAFKEKLIFAN